MKEHFDSYVIEYNIGCKFIPLVLDFLFTTIDDEIDDPK
jgi:hypothetical protein